MQLPAAPRSLRHHSHRQNRRLFLSLPAGTAPPASPLTRPDGVVPMNGPLDSTRGIDSREPDQGPAMLSPLLIAKAGTTELFLQPGMANRHGLITGATGTGKTVTLQCLAERFSAIGVPVFLADVKGDLSGLAAAGSLS